MLKSLRVIGLAAMVVVSVVGFSATAGARPVSGHRSITATTFTVTTARHRIPNSNIEDKGGKVGLHPSTLRVTWAGPRAKRCTASRESFTITNKTKREVGDIAPGGKLGGCFWGTGIRTVKFPLRDSHLTLTLKIH
jgi:hypothetical protein